MSMIKSGWVAAARQGRLRVSGMCLLAVIGLVACNRERAAPPPSTTVDPRELVTRARKLDADGRQDAAIPLYQQALTQAPDSFDAHYGLARALDLAGRYDEARDHFSRAIDLSADEGAREQALRMLGVSWVFSGDAPAALPSYQRVFDARVKRGDAAGAAEVANELGRVLLESGDLAGAREWYKAGYTTAIEKNATGREADLARLRWAHAQARMAIREGDRTSAAREVARVKALLAVGTNADQQIQYPYLTGYVAFYSRDYPRAIADLKQADQQDPFILLLIAEAYEERGDVEMATSYYRKVLTSTSHAINNAFARPAAQRKLARLGG